MVKRQGGLAGFGKSVFDKPDLRDRQTKRKIRYVTPSNTAVLAYSGRKLSWIRHRSNQRKTQRSGKGY
jgi:hypothetical protein